MNHPVDPIIDYACPCMLAEIALKHLHHAALQNDFEAAVEHGIDAIVQTRLAVQNLKLMKERQDALREQAKAVQT